MGGKILKTLTKIQRNLKNRSWNGTPASGKPETVYQFQNSCKMQPFNQNLSNAAKKLQKWPFSVRLKPINSANLVLLGWKMAPRANPVRPRRQFSTRWNFESRRKTAVLFLEIEISNSKKLFVDLASSGANTEIIKFPGLRLHCATEARKICPILSDLVRPKFVTTSPKSWRPANVLQIENSSPLCSAWFNFHVKSTHRLDPARSRARNASLSAGWAASNVGWAFSSLRLRNWR